MNGVLFDELTVEIHSDSRVYGGAWRANATANDPTLLRVFYQWGSRQTEPFTVLDIGASTGSFTLLAAHLPLMRVIAFEPVSKVRDILSANVDLNRLGDRVTVRPEAISDEPGLKTLHIVEPDGSIALSMLGGVPSGHKQYQNELVTVATVDELAADLTVAAIKIDVEGNEFAVLRGAAETLKRDRPAMLIECNYENTCQYGYNPHQLTDWLTTQAIRWQRHDIDLLTGAFCDT